MSLLDGPEPLRLVQFHALADWAAAGDAVDRSGAVIAMAASATAVDLGSFMMLIPPVGAVVN
ncbi:hypothetical protein E1267_02515 [Nonomuraea longispora]|uniref:Uncharacterized protein n=1 Tax=Nonomuraea longispora TaxID=1848320 RepID=A0A4R4NPS5_9ACTN|nr:hypothetical protein [Nonomuraea longispora]TDC10854.1 hypothetical protein E1267_02515 [Nonomuraea longispora]